MTVFISWSGDRSRLVANALAIWLPRIVHQMRPWLSEEIAPGARWGAEVERHLTASRFGVLCVTPENQGEPWIMFEAGALAWRLPDTHVCPYLFGIESAQLTGGPLSQFQAKEATMMGTRDLAWEINGLTSVPLDRAAFEWSFDAAWKSLSPALDGIPSMVPAAARRSHDEMLVELVESVRQIKQVILSQGKQEVTQDITETKPTTSPKSDASGDFAEKVQALLAQYHVQRGRALS